MRGDGERRASRQGLALQVRRRMRQGLQEPAAGVFSPYTLFTKPAPSMHECLSSTEVSMHRSDIVHTSQSDRSRAAMQSVHALERLCKCTCLGATRCACLGVTNQGVHASEQLCKVYMPWSNYARLPSQERLSKVGMSWSDCPRFADASSAQASRAYKTPQKLLRPATHMLGFRTLGLKSQTEDPAALGFRALGLKSQTPDPADCRPRQSHG
eukprot:363417-Chlamydomonas_euryale.AAC.8